MPPNTDPTAMVTVSESLSVFLKVLVTPEAVSRVSYTVLLAEACREPFLASVTEFLPKFTLAVVVSSATVMAAPADRVFPRVSVRDLELVEPPEAGVPVFLEALLRAPFTRGFSLIFPTMPCTSAAFMPFFMSWALSLLWPRLLLALWVFSAVWLVAVRVTSWSASTVPCTSMEASPLWVIISTAAVPTAVSGAWAAAAVFRLWVAAASIFTLPLSASAVPFTLIWALLSLLVTATAATMLEEPAPSRPALTTALALLVTEDVALAFTCRASCLLPSLSVVSFPVAFTLPSIWTEALLSAWA